MKRMSFIAVFFLSICSCLVFQSRRAQDLYIESGYAERIQRAELVLDSLAVRKGFDSQALEENAAYILQLLLAGRNQDSATAGQTLLLHALIKEEEFSRELRDLNTVTVELSIFDPPKTRAVVLALYSENTKDTIDSYAYLHSVIRRAFDHLLR
jgi:hypothetical protein